ncbi:hypothetical protein [Marinicella rhabdoformis]|uniref:hypothetical protein n=1 Tax=Marinicella rhabdoformis TaxID=2580566 RepID=UPI0012AEDF97|nr:hypothetical protein [Marinicella rhabdoformis]
MDDQKSHWSAYWKTGSLTSLPQDFKRNYDGELADFWGGALNELPQSATVVDVCTGNLALPLLFSQLNVQVNKQLNLMAVDLARIEKSDIMKAFPEVSSYLDGITVFDETAVEAIDEKIDQPVDMITSQYGLEYCETSIIAPQIYQLLKPGGCLVFVSHATDTDILKSMKSEKEAFDILQKLKVFSVLKSFGEGRFQPAYFHKQLTKQLPAIHQALIKKPMQLLQVFHQALGGLSQLSLDQIATQQRAVKQFYQQQWMAQMRAADLLWVSEKISNNPEWYLAFEAAGLVLEEQKNIWYKGKHNAGTSYKFRKPTK